jgi:hypothetical protein
MQLTTNYIPEDWKPNDKLAFMIWMQKIQSNFYTQIQ